MQEKLVGGLVVAKETTRLILIRHAETMWTSERRYQGQSDLSLTKAGRDQARAIGKRIRCDGIEVLYSSSLRRARETGEIISDYVRKKPRLDPRLNEISFGYWEGKKAQELLREKEPAFLKWCKGKDVTPPGGERMSRFKNRVFQFLHEKLKVHKGKKIALVSHGGPIRMMIYKALGFEPPFWTFQIDPASISVLLFLAHFTQLAFLNDTAHLARIKNSGQALRRKGDSR